MSTNKSNKSKKILMTESENMNMTESEKLLISASQFNALMQNRDTTFKQAVDETISLSAHIKALQEKTNIYEKALSQERNKYQILANELNVHKSKNQTSPDINILLEKMRQNTEYLNKNKAKLIEDAYKKNHAKEIDELKKKFGL